MGYVSTGLGGCFGALPMSLMALWLELLDQNPFRPCLCLFIDLSWIYHGSIVYTVTGRITFILIYPDLMGLLAYW